MSHALYTLPKLYKASVIKRPSAIIKSPYVADILFEDGRQALCHTPSLGCCGLVEKGCVIYVSDGTPGSKTEYTAQLSECTDETGTYYVGVHPLISQKAARELLAIISSEATWKSEVVVDKHTRIDYVGTLPSGKKICVEIKTAPVSVQCHMSRHERCAIFPEGYRKKSSDTISPRAVKHAETLKTLLAQEDTEMCVLLFVVPRHDCERGLQINSRDPIYHQAVQDAKNAGVCVRSFALQYTTDGSICKSSELKVHV